MLKKQKEDEKQKQEEDKKNPKPKHLKQSFMRLFSYTWKYKCTLLVANVAMLVSALGMVVLPYLSGEMIDDIKN